MPFNPNIDPQQRPPGNPEIRPEHYPPGQPQPTPEQLAQQLGNLAIRGTQR